jgi:hypothetical protein
VKLARHLCFDSQQSSTVRLTSVDLIKNKVVENYPLEDIGLPNRRLGWMFEACIPIGPSRKFPIYKSKLQSGGKMIARIALVVSMLGTLFLVGAQATSTPGRTSPVPFGTCGATQLAARLSANGVVTQESPCASCGAKCQNYVDECKAGNQKSCYRAAACLCQCNLDAGGCGSDKEALQKCVDDNNKNAEPGR